MKRLNSTFRKFCFISNANQSYLSDYINLSRNDLTQDFSFKELNLSILKAYSPNIIIIDQYFTDDDYSSVINSIKLNFKDVKIYFLSPEYANYNDVIHSLDNKNHFYSSFSVEILNHINSNTINEGYSEAS